MTQGLDQVDIRLNFHLNWQIVSESLSLDHKNPFVLLQPQDTFGQLKRE